MLSASFKEPQSAASVLMVRPASFGFNPQSAATNSFVHALRDSQALRAESHGAEAAPSENLPELR